MSKWLTFSPRQLQVLQAMLERRSQEDTAQRLGIRPLTVREYRTHIRNRLRRFQP